MSATLLDAIKRASLDVMDNKQMCDLRFGTVVSTAPLKVQVTTLFTIPESLLIVPEHLTDYEIDITTAGYGWNTDPRAGGGGEATYASHDHEINEVRTTVMVHGALKIGDKVAVLRKQGGQSYFILDRL